MNQHDRAGAQALERLRRGPARLLCDHCGDVIGVYEMLVVRSGDEIRETSRAADPALSQDRAEHYHRECFATLQQEAAAPERAAGGGA
jgi:hypothetical protein